MKCGKCGAELKEGARFCPKCGSRVEAAASGKALTKLPEKTAVVPAPQRQQEVTPPQKKKKPFFAVLLILAFIAAAAAAGIVVWQLKNKTSDNRGNADTVQWGGSTKDEEDSEREDPDEEDPDEKEPDEDGNREQEKAGTEKDESGGDEALETTEGDSETEAVLLTTEAALAEEKPHRYEIVRKDCTWTEAFEDAKARGGYLVHFDTPEEYELVKEQLLSDGSADKLKLWIGGARSADVYEYHWANTDGTFRDEVLNSQPYAWAWMKNEPSFRDSSVNQDEYFMNMFYYKSEKRWVWNDVPNDIIAVVSSYKGQVGYICEYDE